MAKISIIVPIYMVEKYIHRCIDSLLAQEYKDVEVLLIDDCSPDCCGKICDEYAEKYDHIRVVHHENNLGLSSARNTGIKHAGGEWIMFVDPDDWITANALSKLGNYMSDDIDLIVFGAVLEFEGREGEIRKRRYIVPDILTADTPMEIGNMLVHLEKKHCFQYAWNKMYRASVIKGIHAEFKDIMRMEDFVYNAYMWKHFHKIICIDYVAYHYRRFDGGGTLALKYSPEFFLLAKKRYRKEMELLVEFEADSERNIYEIRYVFLKHIVSALARNESADSNLNYFEKCKAAKIMVCDSEVQDFLQAFKPCGIKNRSICFLLKTKIWPLMPFLGKAAKSILLKG